MTGDVLQGDDIFENATLVSLELNTVPVLKDDTPLKHPITC